MSKTKECPNCGGVHTKDDIADVCILDAILGCVIDRENVTAQEAAKHYHAVDVEALWERVGPVVDWVEAEILRRVG